MISEMLNSSLLKRAIARHRPRTAWKFVWITNFITIDSSSALICKNVRWPVLAKAHHQAGCDTIDMEYQFPVESC